MPAELVGRVFDLLGEGLSRRRVARELGLDRKVVDRLATGKHAQQLSGKPDYLMRTPPLDDQSLALFWKRKKLSAAEQLQLSSRIAEARDRVFHARLKWVDATRGAAGSIDKRSDASKGC